MRIIRIILFLLGIIFIGVTFPNPISISFLNNCNLGVLGCTYFATAVFVASITFGLFLLLFALDPPDNI